MREREKETEREISSAWMEITRANNQVMTSHTLEDVLLGCSKPQQQQQEKKPRPHPETALKCPRCDSTNTKFCYYNNYSLSQPRYFCKGCRRYWTKGGSLRNVPVGGGCRKNKKSSTSTSRRTQDQVLTTNLNRLLPSLPPQPPSSLSYDPNDLSLAFARLHSDSFLIRNPNPNPSPISTVNSNNGLLDILRSGFLHDNTTINPNGFHNLYNGYGEGMEGRVGVDGGLLGSSVTTAATITTTTPCTSQSSQKCMDGEANKVVMGLQWQFGGDMNMSLDSGMECWNGPTGSSSSWHGLINSSLI